MTVFNRPSRRRRAAALALLLSLGAGLLSACQKPAAQGPVVRIGYSAWPGWFPWAVTEAKGLFGMAGVAAILLWFDG
jgi:NitT/TauT family transport system substrate-binding protein